MFPIGDTYHHWPVATHLSLPMARFIQHQLAIVMPWPYGITQLKPNNLFLMISSDVGKGIINAKHNLIRVGDNNPLMGFKSYRR